jgi:hypothetical protein
MDREVISGDYGAAHQITGERLKGNFFLPFWEAIHPSQISDANHQKRKPRQCLEGRFGRRENQPAKAPDYTATGGF